MWHTCHLVPNREFGLADLDSNKKFTAIAVENNIVVLVE